MKVCPLEGVKHQDGIYWSLSRVGSILTQAAHLQQSSLLFDVLGCLFLPAQLQATLLTCCRAISRSENQDIHGRSSCGAVRMTLVLFHNATSKVASNQFWTEMHMPTTVYNLIQLLLHTPSASLRCFFASHLSASHIINSSWLQAVVVTICSASSFASVFPNDPWH